MTGHSHEPCPFCGDPMEWAAGDYLRHRVQTPGCPIALNGYPDEAAWNRRVYQIAKPSADLVDAIAATLRRVGPVEGGGYREQARAVIALFAAREKAAAELLRAAAPFVNLINAWSSDVRFCPEPHDAAIEHTGQTQAWVTAQECETFLNAIAKTKVAGLGGGQEPVQTYVPCGGCGAKRPDQRCIGCHHPFENTAGIEARHD